MKIRSILLLLLTLVAAEMVFASEFDVKVSDSRWLESEQLFAYRAIRKTDFDLLILPVQGEENSFDPVGRSLITRLIADRIITGANLSVPNPTYVFRVLGSHRSTYSEDDIGYLVDRVAPREIVELHANHNRSGRFDLVVSVIDGPSRTMQRSRSWSDLEFSDAKPPSVVIKAILDEIFEFVTDQKLPAITPPQTLPLDNFRFTMSFDELITESARSSLHSAAYLQLLGMLHPHGDFNEARYGLFERSLVQLGRLPDDYPGKRLFAARAYAYLGRRPAAIEALGEPQTMHERALLAVLNGDLPALRQEVEKMATSALDFMAWRELAWLEWSYSDSIERDTIERFVEDAPAWASFIYRALRDTSFRPGFSPANIKFGLEQLLPNDVTTIQLIADAATVTGDFPTELELTRLVWRHLDAVDVETVAVTAGRPENYLSVSELDIVDLSKAVAVANQLLRVEHDLSTKDLPDAALSKIAEFDPLLSGHPAVALQKARALDALARNASGAELQTLRDQSATEFLQGLAWTGQMTKDAAAAAQRYDASIRQLHLGKYSVRGKSIRIVPGDPIR